MKLRHAPAISLRALFVSLWRNRQLIVRMARREVIGRYQGSIMGLAWSFLNPLIMLAVYTFVFSVVFNARWNVRAAETKVELAIALFAGLIIHNVFAECVNRAPGLILANVSYVKKVVLPLEILPWITMGCALFHASVSVAVLLVAQLASAQVLPWTAALFPLVIIPLVLGTMGCAWALAAVGVFVRDMQQTIALVSAVLLFLSPVFYPTTGLPDNYQFLLKLNPLTLVIEETRKVLIWGRVPDWQGWAIYSIFSLALAWAGFWSFQRLRRGFADVV